MTLASVLALSGLNALIPFLGGWFGFVGAKRWLAYMSAFTGGVLLATAFFDIMPSVLPAIYTKAFVWFFVGLVGCFLFQHLEDSLTTIKSWTAGMALLVGSGVAHNLVYGAVIGVGFFAGVPSAAFAAIVLGLSDIPHEVGVFGLLSHKNYTHKQSLIIQGAIAATTIPGAIVAYLYRSHAVAALPILLTLLASWFTYLVVGDLMQDMRQPGTRWRPSLVWLLLGAGLVYWLVYHFGRGAFGYHALYIDHP